MKRYDTIEMKKVVVVGIGYVGTAVACSFAKAGYEVVGIDNQDWKVDYINGGISPIEGDEPGLKESIKEAVRCGKLSATKDFTACRSADAIIIAVNTPVKDENKMPDYGPLRSVTQKVGENIRRGSLVVVESTIAPTTMDKVVRPILEKNSGMTAGKEFYLANCPERVTPGRLLYNLEHYNRVLGGIDEASARKALGFYKDVVKADIDLTDCLTAEIVKTAENAYRDVQIAFANEVALICESLGADVFKVRKLVNKCPFRDMHLPGAGVGGHCIPKDSWLLASSVRGKVNARLLTDSRRINDSMPYHMIELLKSAFKSARKSLRGSKIAVLGLAFLPDSDDLRNSPAIPVINILRKAGCKVSVHDPYVLDFYIDYYKLKTKNVSLTRNLDDSLKNADCVIVITLHSVYKNLDPMILGKAMRSRIIIDGRNLFDRKECAEAGFVYRGIGK